MTADSRDAGRGRTRRPPCRDRCRACRWAARCVRTRSSRPPWCRSTRRPSRCGTREPLGELTEQPIERAARHALVRVRVPAAELHRRDVRARSPAQDPRRRLHQRRDAAAPRAAARASAPRRRVPAAAAPPRTGRAATGRRDRAPPGDRDRRRPRHRAAPATRSATSNGPVIERGMPGRDGDARRAWPSITWSRRLSQPSDEPTGRSRPVSSIACPSKWLRVRYGIAIACSATSWSSSQKSRSGARPGARPNVSSSATRSDCVVGERAAQRPVRGITVRHHGGEPVEAAAQQHEHEPARLPAPARS